MAVEIPHLDKRVWVVLIGGAIILGLYLRHRGASVSTTDSTPGGTLNGTDTLPDLGNTGDPYSTTGSATVSGGSPGPQGPAGPRGPRGPKGPGGKPPNRKKHPGGHKPVRTIRHKPTHAAGGPVIVKGHQ